MLKIEWLAAGALLIRSSRIGHWLVVNYAGVECVNSSANGKQGPAALTNKKQAYFEQRHADNIIKRI
jgi:hypothetical protein